MKRRDLIAGGVALSLAGQWKRARAAEAEAPVKDAPAKAEGPLVLGGHVGPVSQIAYSPDGRWLASSAAQLNGEQSYIGGQTLLWDVRAGKLERVLLPDIEGQRIEWSSDGRTLALPGMRWEHGHGAGSVQLWDTSEADASKWAVHHTLEEANASAFSALSPDGKYFVTGIDDRAMGGAIIWDVESGKQLARLGEQSGFLSSASFAPDGQSLFTTSWKGPAGKFEGTALQWWSTQGEPEKWDLLSVEIVPERISNASISPDGQRLVYVRLKGDMSSCTLVISDARSGKGQREIASDGLLWLPQWSLDNKSLAVSRVLDAMDAQKRRAQVQILDAQNGSISTVIGDGKSMIRALAWSPDGAHLALSNGERAVEIHKL